MSSQVHTLVILNPIKYSCLPGHQTRKGGGVPHFLTNTFTYLFLILYKDRIVKRKTVSRMLFAAELLTD
jgi:hypothetical protein